MRFDCSQVFLECFFTVLGITAAVSCFASATLHSSAAATSPLRATSTPSGPSSPSASVIRPRQETTGQSKAAQLVAFHRTTSPSTSIPNAKLPLPSPHTAPCSDISRLRQHLRSRRAPEYPASSLNRRLDSVSSTPEQGRVRPSHTHRETRPIPHGSTQVRLPTRLRHPLLKI